MSGMGFSAPKTKRQWFVWRFLLAVLLAFVLYVCLHNFV